MGLGLREQKKFHPLILTTKTSPPNVEDVAAIGKYVGKMTGESVTGRLEKLEDIINVSPSTYYGGEECTAFNVIESSYSSVR